MTLTTLLLTKKKKILKEENVRHAKVRFADIYVKNCMPFEFDIGS